MALCFLATALIVINPVCFSDDSDAADSYQARVFIGDGTVNGTIEFAGTGTTLRELLSNAINGNGHTIEFKSNGTVSNLDDMTIKSNEALCIYHSRERYLLLRL